MSIQEQNAQAFRVFVADCPLLHPALSYHPVRAPPEDATLVGSRLQWCSEHGSKIDEIIKLVRSIVSEKKEKVLIFAQCSRNEDPRTKRPGNAQKQGSRNEDPGTKRRGAKIERVH
jgi:hypothetical protein